MSAALSRLATRIAEHIEPAPTARETLVVSAFGLRHHITQTCDYNGGASDFALRLCILADKFGPLESGSSALAALVSVFETRVGPNIYAQLIDALAVYLPGAVSSREGGAVSNLPNPHRVFHGRLSLLAEIAAALQPSACVAVCGLPGVGKTQIALRTAQSLPAVVCHRFFVNADTPASIASGYAEASALLSLPVVQDNDPAHAYTALLRWFQSHDSWFVLYDNADDPAVFNHVPLASGRGRVLITSRAEAIAAYADVFSADCLPLPDAIAALCRYAGRPILSADAASPADAICMDLLCLPIALAQAGTYCLETQVSFAAYRQKLATQPGEMYAWTGNVRAKSLRVVAQTFPFALDWVESRNKCAADLLRRAAFLAADGLYPALFADFGNEYQAALALCARFSLVTLVEDGALFRVHRLTRDVIRHTIPDDAARTHLGTVCVAVAAAYPTDRKTRWNAAAQWLPHAHVCARDALDCGAEALPVGLLLDQCGYELNSRGQYEDALPLLQRAVAIYETIRGADHLDTTLPLNNLAYLYDNMGAYEKAETLYVRALAIRERNLAEDHADIAQSCNNLAYLYNNMERFAESLPLFERALKIREKIFDVNHPDTASTMSNMASLFKNMGDYDRALPLYERAWNIRRATLTGWHPRTASSYSALGAFLHRLGRSDEALPLLEHAVEVRLHLLGAQHPHTLISRKYLEEIRRHLAEQPSPM